jgi:hypothetical protein
MPLGRGYCTFEAVHLKGLGGFILGEIGRAVSVVELTPSGDKFMMTAEIVRRAR